MQEKGKLKKLIEHETTSTRGNTLSILLNTYEFVVHQPLNTGIYSSFIAFLIQFNFASTFHAGSQ